MAEMIFLVPALFYVYFYSILLRHVANAGQCIYYVHLLDKAKNGRCRWITL